MTLIWLPVLQDLRFRGNPATWYGIAVYFLLACDSYWRYKMIDKRDKWIWWITGFFFLIVSMGSIQNFGYLFGRKFSGLVQVMVFNCYLVFYYKALPVIATCFYQNNCSMRGKLVLTVSMFLPVFMFIFEPIVTYYLITGVFVYLTFVFL
jgi:hypothetical protein